MTIDTQKLAADIKRVMELDAKRTRGETPPNDWFVDGWAEVLAVGDEANYGVCSAHGTEDAQFIASAPLMADIIRQQGEVILELREALHKLEKLVCEEDFDESGATPALALSSPLVEA